MMARPLREDRDGDEDGGVNERMCIVTRQGGTPETLIRFVAGPDGSVVPDLKRVLPGRGCWVTASASWSTRRWARSFLPAP